jgi:hypothetical protein
MPSRQNALPREILNRALSIRQPLSELILLGEETHEFPDRSEAGCRSVAAEWAGETKKARRTKRKDQTLYILAGAHLI